MRRAAVDRPSRRRKEALEIRWRRHQAGLGPSTNAEAARFQQAECALRALLDYVQTQTIVQVVARAFRCLGGAPEKALLWAQTLPEHP